MNRGVHSAQALENSLVTITVGYWLDYILFRLSIFYCCKRIGW